MPSWALLNKMKQIVLMLTSNVWNVGSQKDEYVSFLFLFYFIYCMFFQSISNITDDQRYSIEECWKIFIFIFILRDPKSIKGSEYIQKV